MSVYHFGQEWGDDRTRYSEKPVHERIISLKRLKEWNKAPTTHPPIVLEWFLDWFFEELLMNNNFKKAKEAYDTVIEFTEKCENMTNEDAIRRCYRNLKYYSGYSANWANKLIQFYDKNPHYRTSTTI